MKKASIVIPVFKSRLTLSRALESISQLAFPDEIQLEVVAILDGADSACEKIFKDWQKKYDIYSKFIVPEHGGVVKARNLGALEAEGENIAFLDADDEFTFSRLESLKLELNGQILIGKQEIINDTTQRYEEPLLHPSDHHIMSFVMKRSDFHSIGGFSNNYSSGSEWDLMIRAREFGLRVELTDEVFIRRHIHNENTSHNNSLVIKEHLSAVRDHIKRNWQNPEQA